MGATLVAAIVDVNGGTHETFKKRATMEPLDLSSEDIRNQRAAIAHTIRQIRKYGGQFEIALGEEMTPEIVALFPLKSFVAYVKRGYYPPPELVEYFADCVAAYLDAEPSPKALHRAFSLDRSRGGQSEELKWDRQERDGWIAVHMFYLLHDDPDHRLPPPLREWLDSHRGTSDDVDGNSHLVVKVDAAADAVGRYHDVSGSNVMRIYYGHRAAIEAALAPAARTHAHDAPGAPPASSAGAAEPETRE